MPDIYSESWCRAMIELADSRQDLSEKAPQGEWRIAIEIEGDRQSPYIEAGSTKHFFTRLVDGKLKEIKEVPEAIPGKGLHYRITGPATVFEEMAAGILDPVEKGLDGTITIRGDMRLFIQNAELLNIIFDVYTQSDITDWPKAKPPYG